MPTPFSHLVTAQNLLADDHFPAPHRTFIEQEWGAFLLGMIAADAQREAGLRRHHTHFFRYSYPISPAPNDAMLATHPDLRAAALRDRPTQRAFVAGYVGHLKYDEGWWMQVAYPHFVDAAWSDSLQRELIFHALLTAMDLRDYAMLSSDIYPALAHTEPKQWLPFLPDAAIVAWRDIVAHQLAPNGTNITLQVFGGRIMQGEAGLRALLEDETRLNTELWATLPQTTLQAYEAQMYQQMRATIIAYLDNS